MSKLEHTHPLMIALTNIYKSGGVKRALSDSSCDEINPSTHICKRLFALPVQRAAFIVSICFLLSACQQAYLIPDDEDSSTRVETDTTEVAKDSTDVDVNVTGNGWGEPINVGFEFGGEQEGDE